MSFRRRAAFCLLACLAIAACGDVPEPFLGNPGATARRLAQPLTPLLAIPPGSDTMLPDAANEELAKRIAGALRDTEVPALEREPQKTDWRVVTTAQRDGKFVKPIFTVKDPQGKERRRARRGNRCHCEPGPRPRRTCCNRSRPRRRHASEPCSPASRWRATRPIPTACPTGRPGSRSRT